MNQCSQLLPLVEHLVANTFADPLVESLVETLVKIPVAGIKQLVDMKMPVEGQNLPVSNSS